MSPWEDIEADPEFGTLTPQEKVSLFDDWHKNTVSSFAEIDPEEMDPQGLKGFMAFGQVKRRGLLGEPVNPDQITQQYLTGLTERSKSQKQMLADYDALEKASFALKDAENARMSAVVSETYLGEGAKILDQGVADRTLARDRAKALFTPELEQQAKEARESMRGERPVAVLGSDIYTDPSLTLDKEEYRKAVNGASASPEAKMLALADFTSRRDEFAKNALRVFRVAGEAPIPGMDSFASWEARQPKEIWSRPPEDKALEYLRQMRGREGYRKLLSAIGTGAVQGGADVAAQGLGLGAMVSGNRALAQKAGEVQKGAEALSEVQKLEGDASATGATTAGGVARLGVGMAPAIGAGLVTGGSLTAAALAAGAQTAGAQFPSTYNAMLEQGKSEDEALRASRGSALMSGAVTSALTALGGTSGVEALIRRSGEGFARGRVASILLGSIKEIPEELADEAASQVIESSLTNPDKPVSQVVDEFLGQAPDLALQVGLLGGAGEAFAPGGKKPPTPQPTEESEEPMILGRTVQQVLDEAATQAEESGSPLLAQAIAEQAAAPVPKAQAETAEPSGAKEPRATVKTIPEDSPAVNAVTTQEETLPLLPQEEGQAGESRTPAEGSIPAVTAENMPDTLEVSSIDPSAEGVVELQPDQLAQLSPNPEELRQAQVDNETPQRQAMDLSGADPIMVVRQKDGTLKVVQGHHRLARAMRDQVPLKADIQNAVSVGPLQPSPPSPSASAGLGAGAAATPQGAIESPTAPKAGKSLSAQLNAANNRDEAKDILANATLQQVKEAAQEMGYPATGTKAAIVGRLVAAVGSRADAKAIRQQSPQTTAAETQTPESLRVDSGAAGVASSSLEGGRSSELPGESPKTAIESTEKFLEQPKPQITPQQPAEVAREGEVQEESLPEEPESEEVTRLSRELNDLPLRGKALNSEANAANITDLGNRIAQSGNAELIESALVGFEDAIGFIKGRTEGSKKVKAALAEQVEKLRQAQTAPQEKPTPATEGKVTPGGVATERDIETGAPKLDPRNDYFANNLASRAWRIAAGMQWDENVGDWVHPDYRGRSRSVIEAEIAESNPPKKADVQRVFNELAKSYGRDDLIKGEKTKEQDAQDFIQVGRFVKVGYRVPVYEKGEVVGGKTNKVVGRITRIMPDGKVEVRLNQGGFKVLPPSEIEDAPTHVGNKSLSSQATKAADDNKNQKEGGKNNKKPSTVTVSTQAAAETQTPESLRVDSGAAGAATTPQGAIESPTAPATAESIAERINRSSLSPVITYPSLVQDIKNLTDGKPARLQEVADAMFESPMQRPTAEKIARRLLDENAAEREVAASRDRKVVREMIGEEENQRGGEAPVSDDKAPLEKGEFVAWQDENGATQEGVLTKISAGRNNLGEPMSEVTLETSEVVQVPRRELRPMASMRPDARDAEYLAAVQAGDMKKAQRMVDEAAKTAGYRVEAWHSTDASPFEVFETKRTFGRIGAYFSDNPDNRFGKNQKRFWLRMPKFNQMLLSETNQIDESFADIQKRVAGRDIFDGYHGLIGSKIEDGVLVPVEYVVFNPEQIKSAAPVTYDDAGNVIPLSQRFQPSSPDIRFSKKPTNPVRDARAAAIKSLRGHLGKEVSVGVSAVDGINATTSLQGAVPGVQKAWIGTREDFLADESLGRAFPGVRRELESPRGEQLEGLFDGGRAFVFTNNVGVYEGDVQAAKEQSELTGEEVTPQQAAVQRVITHEGLVHRGFYALDKDTRRALFQWGAQNIYEAEMDAMAEEYGYADDWRTNERSREWIMEEILAKKIERLKAPPKSGPLKALWDILASLWRKLTGSVQEVTLKDIQDVAKVLRTALELSENNVETRNGMPIRVGVRPHPSYAGERAIENLPEERRQFMRDSLDAAKAMAAAGKSSEEIRVVTGWFPGKYDGKMRWEVPDEGARLKNINAATLGELLEHPSLFETHPSLANVEVYAGPQNSYSQADDSVSLRDFNVSTVLHEVQHAIQKREGFAKGGDSRMAFADPRMGLGSKKGLAAANRILQEILTKMGQPLSIEVFAERAWQSGVITDEIKQSYADYVATAKRAASDPGNIRIAQETASKEWYRRLAGEIEARDVQARQKLTPEQRKAVAPYSSENIAPEDAIVLMPPMPSFRPRFTSPLDATLSDTAKTLRLMRDGLPTTPVDLQAAYASAVLGKSSAMVSLDDLFAAAKESTPSLTEADFGQQVQNLYNDNGAYVEPAESPAVMKDFADRYNVRSAQGIPATYVMVLEPQRPMASMRPDVRDAEHFAAVEAGDMETAQRMVDEAEVKTNFGEGFYRAGSGKEQNNIYITDSQEDAEKYLVGSTLLEHIPKYWTRKELDLTSIWNGPVLHQIEKASGVKNDLYSRLPFEEINRQEVRNAIWAKGYDSIRFPDKHNQDMTDHVSILIRSREQFLPQKNQSTQAAALSAPKTQSPADALKKTGEGDSPDIRFSLRPDATRLSGSQPSEEGTPVLSDEVARRLSGLVDWATVQGPVMVDSEQVPLKGEKIHEFPRQSYEAVKFAADEIVKELGKAGVPVTDMVRVLNTTSLIRQLGYNDVLYQQMMPRIMKLGGKTTAASAWKVAGEKSGRHQVFRKLVQDDPEFRDMFMFDEIRNAQMQQARDILGANAPMTADEVSRLDAEAGRTVGLEEKEVTQETLEEDLLEIGEKGLSPKERTLWEKAKYLVARIGYLLKLGSSDVKPSLRFEFPDSEKQALSKLSNEDRQKELKKTRAELRATLGELLGQRKPRKAAGGVETVEGDFTTRAVADMIQRMQERLNIPVDTATAIDALTTTGNLKGQFENFISDSLISKVRAAMTPRQAPVKNLNSVIRQITSILADNLNLPKTQTSKESLGERALDTFGRVRSNEQMIREAWERSREGIRQYLTQRATEGKEGLTEEEAAEIEEAVDAQLDSIASSVPARMWARGQAYSLIRDALKGSKFDTNEDILRDPQAALKTVQDRLNSEVGKIGNVDPARWDSDQAYVVAAFNSLVADLTERKAKADARRAGKARSNLMTGADKKLLTSFIEQARKRSGDKAPLLPDSATWTKIFSGSPQSQEAKAAEMMEYMKADPLLANLTADEQQQLADMFARRWEQKRKELLEAKVASILKARNATPKGKNAAKDAVPKFIQAINRGELTNDVIAEEIAEKFGFEKLTEGEKKTLERLSRELQEPGIPQHEKTAKIDEMAKIIAKKTRMSMAEILSAWWVTSVLSGPRTAFTIGLAASNGAFEVLGHAVSTVLNANWNGRRAEGIAAAGQALTNYFKSWTRSIQLAWQYVLTGDKKLLSAMDPAYSQFFETGRNNPLSVGWRLSQSKNPVARATGRFMHFFEKLLSALDLLTATTTRHGMLPIAYYLNQKKYDKARVASETDLANYRKKVIDLWWGGKEPTTGAEQALVTRQSINLMEEQLAKYANVLEDSGFAAAQAAMTLTPEGLGGQFYQAVLSVANKAKRSSEKMVREAERLDGKGHGPIERNTRKALAYLYRFLAYQMLIVAGLPFARFAGNKLNQSLGFIPGLGLLRKFEKDYAGPVKTQAILRNQTIGAMMTLVGYSVLKAIADEPDDDKRGWGIEGSWKNLTPDQIKQLQAAGRKQYTIHIGDQSYNYANWPVSSVLAAIGTMADRIKYSPDKWKETSALDKIATGVWAASTTTMDASSLSQLAEVFGSNIHTRDPVEASAKWASRVFGNYAGGMIPRVFKDADMILDGKMGKYDGWENFGKEIPVYRRYVGGPLLDIFGKQVEVSRTPWSREFQVQPPEREYRLLGQLNSNDLWLTPANPGGRRVGRGKRSREMTDAEQKRYVTLVGDGYRKVVLKYGDRLAKMDREAAKDLLGKLTAQVRDRAEKQAVTQQ